MQIAVRPFERIIGPQESSPRAGTYAKFLQKTISSKNAPKAIQRMDFGGGTHDFKNFPDHKKQIPHRSALPVWSFP